MSPLHRIELFIAHYGKHLIPQRFRAAMRAKIEGRFWISDPVDRLKLTLTQLAGKNFLTWYAERLDKTSATGADLFDSTYADGTAEFDFNLVKGFGLMPHHRLHDFGVGYLRAGWLFIDYLEDRKFSGNDISRARIDKGLDYYGRDRLMAKHPNLIITKDNSFDWLKGEKVDFIWCNAVIAHMPPGDVEELFKNIRKIMNKNTVFLVTYSSLDVDRFRTGGEWTGLSRGLREFANSHKGQEGAKFTVKDFLYSLRFFEHLGDRYGLVIEDRSDLLPAHDTISFKRRDMLLKVTL